jgi:hypothetical protein
MEEAIAAVRTFNRFYTRRVGASSTSSRSPAAAASAMRW